MAKKKQQLLIYDLSAGTMDEKPITVTLPTLVGTPAPDSPLTKPVREDIASLTPPSGEPLATASLDKLQSKDYREVLGVVDRLRVSGLGSILQLPQIVVCGDQSSGKSSVLEAITEVPFPRKENLCIRFAT